MADIFHSDDLRSLINGKYVLFFGGSNVRALYKDLLVLLVSNRLISDRELSKKLEPSFLGDSLLHATGLTRGRDFKEHRIFTLDETIFEYFFISKCLCPDVCNTLNEIRSGERCTPDLVIMNSTLWDVTRWGIQSVKLFKENLQKLVDNFKQCLPPTTLVVWLTVPPVSQDHRGLLLSEVEFLKHTMRFDCMEANIFAHRVLTANGFDVLDFHYYMKLNVHRRWKDGIHWISTGVRYMTNLLLTHISLAWGCNALPGKEGRQEIQLEKLQVTIDELSDITAAKISAEPTKKNLSCDKSKPAHEGKSGVTNTEKQEKSKESELKSDSKRPQKIKAVYYGSSAKGGFSRGQSSKKRNNCNEYQPCGERQYQSNASIPDEGSYDHYDFNSDQCHGNVEQFEPWIEDSYSGNSNYVGQFNSNSRRPQRYKCNYNQRRPVKRLHGGSNQYSEHLQVRRTGNKFDTKYFCSEVRYYRGQWKTRSRQISNGSRPRRTCAYRSYR